MIISKAASTTGKAYVLYMVERAEKLTGVEAEHALLGMTCIGLASRRLYSFSEPLPSTEDVGIHGWTEFAYYTGIWKCERSVASMRYAIIPSAVRSAIIARATYTGETVVVCKPSLELQRRQEYPASSILGDDRIQWPDNF